MENIKCNDAYGGFFCEIALRKIMCRILNVHVSSQNIIICSPQYNCMSSDCIVRLVTYSTIYMYIHCAMNIDL